MNQAPLIFCATELTTRLTATFPDHLILPVSGNIETTRKQIEALDNQEQREAWILFPTSGNHQKNMPVRDHINLSTENTLIGPADLEKGPRFPDMSSVYEHTGEGCIVVMGQDDELATFEESWVPVSAGVWEAIALKHRGYKIWGWLVADLEKWMGERSK